MKTTDTESIPKFNPKQKSLFDLLTVLLKCAYIFNGSF